MSIITSHKIRPIPQVVRYFDTTEIPVIASEYTPRKGWRSTNSKKRVSRSWLRRLRREGVTHVQLLVISEDVQVTGRAADFTIEELLKVEDKPLLGGNVV